MGVPLDHPFDTEDPCGAVTQTLKTQVSDPKPASSEAHYNRLHV